MAYQVPTSAIPLLRDPPFVAYLFWLGAAIGWRTLRLLKVGLDGVEKLERGVLAVALGMGFLQFLPWALGMAGLFAGQPILTPSAVWLGLLVLSAAFGYDMFLVVYGILASAASMFGGSDSPRPERKR